LSIISREKGEAQRFRNSVSEVNEQKADQRFQSMGHIRRARKLAQHGGEVQLLSQQDKRLRAVRYYLTGREGASIAKPSVAGIMAAHWQWVFFQFPEFP